MAEATTSKRLRSNRNEPARRTKAGDQPTMKQSVSIAGPKGQKRRRPLTLPEIRAIRRKGSRDSLGNEKRLADLFTLENADDGEKSFLTICRAVYRRSTDAFCEDNVPAEKLIASLLLNISFWPLTLEHAKSALEDIESSWKLRDEAARLLRDEAEETKTLMKQCGERQVGCEWQDEQAVSRIQ